MAVQWKHLWREYRGLLWFVVLMSLFRSVVADWNSVPSGSMKPTLIEGDRILVNKLAYDLRLPFSHISLLALGEPQRGESVIFDSQAADKRLVKRLIGLPGDVVAMADNRLYLNGQWLPYRRASDSDVEEGLAGHPHPVRLQPRPSPLSRFAPVTVPPGHYLVLGDNRDRSADSRVYGFVPREEIVGRSDTVVLSLDYENYYLPRGDRLWQKLP
jgi:signal peptidase I